MKLIKNINNNVAICEDSAGHEVVVFGKGVGVRKPPCDVDVKNIERTFYKVDPRYIEMIQNADDRIISIAMDLKNICDKKNIVTSSNLLFSLIDHISFAIERNNKGIYFSLPISKDINYMFQNEMAIGRYAIGQIKERLGIVLPKEEASYIAMDIVNSETEVSNQQNREDKMIENITDIIEQNMNFKIDRDGASYSRFVSHMHYLLKKVFNDEKNLYSSLISTVKQNYPADYSCAIKVKEYLDKNQYGPLSEDEVLFITMHINRLRLREEN